MLTLALKIYSSKFSFRWNVQYYSVCNKSTTSKRPFVLLWQLYKKDPTPAHSIAGIIVTFGKPPLTINLAGPAGLWTGRRWKRQKNRRKGLWEERKFWLGLSHNYERGRVFKSVGGEEGEGKDSGPSKFWKYKKTNASFLSEDQETGKRIGLN